jgi:Asp/Glu/hydantoin racemase
MTYNANPGRATYGQRVGIIMQRDTLVRVPGDVGNHTTYPFPVSFQVVDSLPVAEIQTTNVLRYADDFVAAARALEADGCRVIATGCGFLTLLQPVLAAAVRVPVVTSALVQVPLVASMLPTGQTVGILTVNAANLSEQHCLAAGWSPRDLPISVIGVDEQPDSSFTRAVLQRVGTEPELLASVERDLVALGRRLVERDPAVGALVLECTNMPPYAHALQHALGLPVFDIVTLIMMMHETVTRRPYVGYC